VYECRLAGGARRAHNALRETLLRDAGCDPTPLQEFAKGCRPFLHAKKYHAGIYGVIDRQVRCADAGDFLREILELEILPSPR
jgi:hypothetical protein